jgi:Protein of unknown function (DUF3301)
MELSWSLLALLLGIIGIAWAWHASLRARERANAAALETCQSTGAQLLDGTVAFRGLRPVRGTDGRLQLERTYVFDYSQDGVTRRQGFVILLGRSLDSIGLE